MVVNQDDIKRTFRRMLTTNFSRSKDIFRKNDPARHSDSNANFEQSHHELETGSAGKSTSHDIESKFIKKYRKLNKFGKPYKED